MNANTNTTKEEQQSLLPFNPDGGGGCDGTAPSSEVAAHLRQTHLTKFAFLLCSARGEGSDEPVVGMHHDVEMAACFSPAGGGCDVPPGSISSSSLSMQGKGGPARGETPPKATLLEMAAVNMSTPFYTTPDTVSSTAKIILTNIVTTMEELLDSRLRSTISQLLSNSLGSVTNSQLLLRLLSPSRTPIQVATVITRFTIPDGAESDAPRPAAYAHEACDFLSIPLQFQAILDVKIFGAVSTVTLVAHVNMAGRFDGRDGLLTAVDVGFDCVGLLKTMIANARSVVKTAATRAAALSVQIVEWDARKRGTAAAGPGPPVAAPARRHSLKRAAATGNSVLSLHSLLGHSLSHNSMASLDLRSTLSTLFTSFPSLSTSTAQGAAGKQQRSASRGLLRSRSLRSRNSFAKNAKNRHQAGGYSSPNNANETFDLSRTVNPLGGSAANAANAASVVRFQMPHGSPPTSSQPNQNGNVGPNPPLSWASQPKQNGGAGPAPPALSWAEPAPRAAPPAPAPAPPAPPDAAKGNIHAGLFSWLRNDEIFLTDEKIREQNAADAESARVAAAAPQPLRFFTAADGLGRYGLEIMNHEIFGAGTVPRRSREGNVKRRKVWPS